MRNGKNTKSSSSQVSSLGRKERSKGDVPVISAGKWQRSIQSGGNQIGPQALDRGKLDGLNAQLSRRVHIFPLVVDKENLFRLDIKFCEHVAINGRIGLGDAELKTPDQHVEAVNPVELAFDVGQHAVAHVGEDGGEQAVLLERELPGHHGGVLGGPQARIPEIQLLDRLLIVRHLCFAQKLLPKGDAGQLAFVVGGPVGPVEAVKPLLRQVRDAQQVGPRGGVRWSGQYNSIVEDNCAQSQSSSPVRPCNVERDACSYCGTYGASAFSVFLVGKKSMRFSRRTDWNTEESELARAHRLRAAAGLPIADLTASNPTRCGFAYDPGLLAALSNAQALDYDPQPRGLLRAREAVCAYYVDHSVAPAPEQIVMTTSTSEAYSFLFRLLCDEGSEILIAQPGYPLFDFLAVLDDVHLKAAPLVYDHGWQIDPEGFRRAITDETRAIVLVHPNNPTGHFTKPWEAEELARLCREFNLALIVDEVFLDYDFGGGGASFAAGLEGVSVFVVSGLSKIAGLPQMKAAWIVVTGPEVAPALDRLEVIADTFLSMNAPVQWALPTWLKGREAIQRQIRNRVAANLAELDRRLAVLPEVRRLEVEGGWYAVVRIPALVPDEQTVLALLERGVWVHPGYFFGMAESGWLVVSLLGPEAEFSRGVIGLVDYLATQQERDHLRN